MSIKYPVLPNTTYPDKIQIFEEKLNITQNDATLIKQVQQLIEQRKFAEANAIRQQIPNYKQKQLIVKDWNEMTDTVVALQLEYDSRYTPSYVLSKEKPNNQFKGDYWYRITNIKYIGETKEIGISEKSPDNPYELKGQKVPNTNLELYSLPNGVYDEYDEISKVYMKRIEKILINGEQKMTHYTNPNRYGLLLEKKGSNAPPTVIPQTVIFSNFNTVSVPVLQDTSTKYGATQSANYVAFAITPSPTNAVKSQEWFLTHPTTVLYELESPEIIQL